MKMIIDLEQKIFVCNSERKYYLKEKDDIKNHTERLVDRVEYINLLDLQYLIDKDEDVSINISDNETGDYILRQVRDITLIGKIAGHYLMSITWDEK
jgi:hypothetical protein